jgi:hypothetical protein
MRAYRKMLINQVMAEWDRLVGLEKEKSEFKTHLDQFSDEEIAAELVLLRAK